MPSTENRRQHTPNSSLQYLRFVTTPSVADSNTRFGRFAETWNGRLAMAS